MPSAITGVVREGEHISSAESQRDFNGDGESDWVVAYGEIVLMERRRYSVVTYVNDIVATFSDNSGIEFNVDDYNRDGIDDLALWLWATASWRTLAWSNDSAEWVDFDVNPPPSPPTSPKPPPAPAR